MPQTATPQATIRVRALLLGERLDLRSLEEIVRLGDRPLIVEAGDSGRAALFPYGAVVLFDVSSLEEMALRSTLAPILSGALESPEFEEVQIVVDPEVKEQVGSGGRIHLADCSLERLQLVADVLAKSVVLAHYEQSVARVFDLVEPAAAALAKRMRRRAQARELIRQISRALLVQHKTVGRVEVLDKPELLWDRPELEGLYLRLQDEYELRDRNVILDRKLTLISTTAETYLDLLQNERSLRVEWYIVVLILVEIFLTIYQMATAGHH